MKIFWADRIAAGCLAIACIFYGYIYFTDNGKVINESRRQTYQDKVEACETGPKGKVKQMIQKYIKPNCPPPEPRLVTEFGLFDLVSSVLKVAFLYIIPPWAVVRIMYWMFARRRVA